MMRSTQLQAALAAHHKAIAHRIWSALLALLLLLTLPCPALGQYQDAWEEMTPPAGADWLGRRSHSSLALPDGSIVLMGGRLDVAPLRRNDVWRSTDKGATWIGPVVAPWSEREGHTSVGLPDGSIVLMGGFAGGITRYNDVWRSTDKGATWTRLTDDAGWTARTNHTSVVLPDGSIVLMGGEDSVERKNDVWRSTDKGATWTEMTANAEWLARNAHTSVALPDGSIVLMGGRLSVAPLRRNDVWRSTDKGATWTEMTAAAGWTARTNHTSVALPDGSIVLMGGTYGVTRYKDVWRSTDQGATWTEMTAAVGWSARSSLSSVVLPDGSIVLMGGIDAVNVLKNDVWRLALLDSVANAGLGDAAYRHCMTDGDPWFATMAGANMNRRLIFPYLPGGPDWWAGYALINAHATRNIPQDALCLVGVNEEGRSFAAVHGRPLFAQNMFVGTVPDIDPDEPRWDQRLALGVFKKPEAVADNLLGFTMMGDTVQGAGYFADNQAARSDLSFDYVPGTPWWRGFAVINDHWSETTYIRVLVHQADGRVVELDGRERIELRPGGMIAATLEDLAPEADPDQTARVRMFAETWDGDELEVLHGFVIFGDGRQATGYLGQ